MGTDVRGTAETWVMPPYVSSVVARAGAKLTEGLPSDTWNSMTPDTYTVGGSKGPRQVHLLLPGVHCTSMADAEVHFAWSEPRRRLWDELVRAAPMLMEKYGIRYVVGGGSFFCTDAESPSDMDLIVFRDPAAKPTHPWARNQWRNPLSDFNRAQGEHGIHLMPSDFSIELPGGPPVMNTLRYAPPVPRPQSPLPGGPRGPEVGLVLLDLKEICK